MEAKAGVEPPVISSLQQAKRLIKIVVGFSLLGVGIAMLVLPGPGIVAIMFGLALLSAEYVWARRLLRRMKAAAQQARDTISRRPAVKSDSERSL